MIKLFIFIIIFVIFFIIDLYTRLPKCKNKSFKVILLIFLHRLYYTFLYYGWIFDNKILLIIYLFLIIFTYIHWLTNDWKCKQTEIENDLCKYDKYMYFDYIYLTFNENIAKIISNIYIISIIITIFYKLFKN